MTQEQDPSIEEIKEQIEIPVEEDDIEGLKAEEKAQDSDVVSEFKKLGRQFAQTLESAWNSEERVRVEAEIRQGVHSFVDEVDKVIREARDSETFQKVKGEAVDAKGKVERSDLGEKTRQGIVQGLSWMSDELAKLADQFQPPEKGPEAPEESLADQGSADEPVVKDPPYEE
jgi:hypothetical protein